MTALKNALKNPYVRLAARALLAAATVAVTQIHTAGGSVAWHSVAVAAVLAFAEVFTPLNPLVGLWKQLNGNTPAVPAAKA